MTVLSNRRKNDLQNVGVNVTKTFRTSVPGGTKWEVHFQYARSLLSRAEGKQYARVYICEEYGHDDIAFFANPKTIDNTFYAVFFTEWR